jgi:hypothetical protein
MFNTIVGAGSVVAGAASRYGSGSDQMMRLLAAPAPVRNTANYQTSLGKIGNIRCLCCNNYIHSIIITTGCSRN